MGREYLPSHFPLNGSPFFTFHVGKYSLHSAHLGNNSPLELLIINPYWNNVVFTALSPIKLMADLDFQGLEGP